MKNTDTTGSGTGGQLTWNYRVAAADVEYLAAGQTKVESFTITLDDQNGGLITRQIDVTVTGTNDAPVIGVQDLAGAVTELVTPVGNLTDSGTIAFGDVDLTDVHLVSAMGAPVGSVLGALTAVKNTDTVGSGTGGQLTWTYSVAASDVEYLAAGQTRVESFTITLDDQNGSVVTRQIDVTITGTNDAPIVTAQDLIGAVTESVTPAGDLSDSGVHCLHRCRPERPAPRICHRNTRRQRPRLAHRREGQRHHRQRHRRPADLDLPRRRCGRRVPRCRPDQGRELHHHPRRPERRPDHPPDRRDDHRHQRRAGGHRARISSARSPSWRHPPATSPTAEPSPSATST